MQERLYQHVAGAVRARRELLGKTQQEVAASAGLTRSAFASIESGRQTVMLHQLYALARALDTTPSALMPEFEPRVTPEGQERRPHKVEQFVRSLDRVRTRESTPKFGP